MPNPSTTEDVANDSQYTHQQNARLKATRRTERAKPTHRTTGGNRIYPQRGHVNEISPWKTNVYSNMIQHVCITHYHALMYSGPAISVHGCQVPFEEITTCMRKVVLVTLVTEAQGQR